MKRDEFVENLMYAHMEDLKQSVYERAVTLLQDGIISTDNGMAVRRIVNLQMESYLRGVQDACEQFREVFSSSRKEAQ